MSRLTELLRPMHPAATRAADHLSLVARVRDALAAPPQPNHYVAPRLRTIDAVAYAVRGYRVRWTTPKPPTEHRLDPSVLVYDVESAAGDRHGVELPMLLPGEVHIVASWIRGARTIGVRFAWWQAQRELQWVMQRRAMKSAMNRRKPWH